MAWEVRAVPDDSHNAMEALNWIGWDLWELGCNGISWFLPLASYLSWVGFGLNELTSRLELQFELSRA